LEGKGKISPVIGYVRFLRSQSLRDGDDQLGGCRRKLSAKAEEVAIRIEIVDQYHVPERCSSTEYDRIGSSRVAEHVCSKSELIKPQGITPSYHPVAEELRTVTYQANSA
jgi:hypothetical protein